MLPRVLELTDPSGAGYHVDDLEKLCRGVLGDCMRFGWLPAALSDADFDEFLGFALGEAFVIRGRYRHGPGGEFPGWLHYALRFRVADEVRRMYGRHGQHRPLADAGTLAGDRLDGAFAEGPGDPGADWRPACLGGLDGRDRTVAELLAGTGVALAEGTPRRARGAGRVAA